MTRDQIQKRIFGDRATSVKGGTYIPVLLLPDHHINPSLVMIGPSQSEDEGNGDTHLFTTTTFTFCDIYKRACDRMAVQLLVSISCAVVRCDRKVIVHSLTVMYQGKRYGVVRMMCSCFKCRVQATTRETEPSSWRSRLYVPVLSFFFPLNALAIPKVGLTHFNPNFMVMNEDFLTYNLQLSCHGKYS